MADKKKRVEKLEKELDPNAGKKELRIVHLYTDDDEAEYESKRRKGVKPREDDLVINHVRLEKEPKK